MREKIEKIIGMQVLDSRGNPTVQVKVVTDRENEGKFIVPSGASTGGYEAVELRDNNKAKYGGKGVEKAVYNVNEIINPALKGMNVLNQRDIDRILLELDGTKNKSNIGANAILGVSLATARAGANSLKFPLFRYLGGIIGNTIPIPMMNIINGGKHANNNLNIQEFMIVPTGAKSFSEAIEMGTNIYSNLKRYLKKEQLETSVGDEGGFAPNLVNDEEAISIICEIISISGYRLGEDISLALDIAANEMHEEAMKIKEVDKYYFWKTGELRSKIDLIKYYNELIDKYPIISIEDGLAEDDFEGWKILNEELGNKIKIVGDDLFVTNKERVQKGINESLANTILIKPNQIGTLVETLEAINLAKKAGMETIISHRSGETSDDSIADLAVATNSKYIKAGAPARGERVAKYNRLLEIEKELKT